MGNKIEKECERRIPEKYSRKAEKTRIFGDKVYSKDPYTVMLSIRRAVCFLYDVFTCSFDSFN